MKNLYLIRGPSGSGKSTFASKINSFVHEADNYFLDESGIYHFDPYLLSEAHKMCQDNVAFDMAKGYEDIVVANTFTRKWEMYEYTKLAAKYGYSTTIIVMNRPWDAEELFKRNVHNVPLEAIKKQIERFEE